MSNVINLNTWTSSFVGTGNTTYMSVSGTAPDQEYTINNGAQAVNPCFLQTSNFGTTLFGETNLRKQIAFSMELNMDNTQGDSILMFMGSTAVSSTSLGVTSGVAASIGARPSARTLTLTGGTAQPYTWGTGWQTVALTLDFSEDGSSRTLSFAINGSNVTSVTTFPSGIGYFVGTNTTFGNIMGIGEFNGANRMYLKVRRPSLVLNTYSNLEPIENIMLAPTVGSLISANNIQKYFSQTATAAFSLADYWNTGAITPGSALPANGERISFGNFFRMIYPPQSGSLICRYFPTTVSNMSNTPAANTAFSNLTSTQILRAYAFNNPTGNLYCMEFTGTMSVSNGGAYVFGTNSDDASDFSVYSSNLWRVITHYYGLHGLAAAPPNPGTINLVSGKSYPIRLRYHQGISGAGLALQWKPPDSPSTWSNVPFSVFKCNRGSPMTTNMIRAANFPDPAISTPWYELMRFGDSNLLSPNNVMSLSYQSDGNVVLRSNGAAIWSTGGVTAINGVYSNRFMVYEENNLQSVLFTTNTAHSNMYSSNTLTNLQQRAALVPPYSLSLTNTQLSIFDSLGTQATVISSF